jgi:hypothetical protein
MTTHHRIIPAALAALALGASATPALAMPYRLDGGGSFAPAHTTASTSPPRSATAGGDFLAPAAPPPVVRAEVVRVQAPKSGFDWGDAGIGAAGAVGLAALTGGGALVIAQRRTRRPTTPPGAIS